MSKCSLVWVCIWWSHVIENFGRRAGPQQQLALLVLVSVILLVNLCSSNQPYCSEVQHCFQPVFKGTCGCEMVTVSGRCGRTLKARKPLCRISLPACHQKVRWKQLWRALWKRLKREGTVFDEFLRTFAAFCRDDIKLPSLRAFQKPFLESCALVYVNAENLGVWVSLGCLQFKCPFRTTWTSGDNISGEAP